MKKLGLTFLLLTLTLSGFVRAQGPYTIMHPDRETRLKWIEQYNRAPKACIEPDIKPPRGSLSLLSHLQYIPAERDQGYCGNCWAWAGTGCLGIALDVQAGIHDRLSMQYINSCETEVIGKTCCDGGWLEDVTDFYSIVGQAIPWSNDNAHWQDGDASCDTPCDSVSTNPNYPISHISTLKIDTQGVGKDTAIANIKNILAQDKAIWFAFFLATSDDWGDFSQFWSNQDESTVWDFDPYCGKNWSGGAGHAVLCVGYNDDDPQNSYWIMLNSWGSSSNRPNVLFRVNMDMNYDCTYKDGGTDYYSLYWQTIDVGFNIVTPTPTPVYADGDSCQTAIDASAGGTFTGSTVSCHNLYNPSASDKWQYSWGMAGLDYVFKIDITKPTGENGFDARVTSADYDHALYLITDCSDTADSYIIGADDNSDNTGEHISATFTEPTTLYLVVDSYHPGVCGTFSIDIQTSLPPAPTPTPTPSPTPSPTPTPLPPPMPEEYTYSFDSGSEGWTFTTIPSVFDEPESVCSDGSIGFTPAGSTNCYGSWKSPFHKFTVGQKYRARFRIRTNQPDQSKVPSFRIRIADDSYQGIALLVINSQGNGENSPTTSGKIYDIIYEPPAAAAENGYFLCVDLINLGDADDAFAYVYIDTVEIKKATVTIP